MLRERKDPPLLNRPGAANRLSLLLLPHTRGRFSGEPSGGWGTLNVMNHSSASQEPEEVALLTGPRAASVLSAALAPAGQRLASWEVHSVHHRPGAGVSVGYTAVVVAPNGRSTTEYLCATTARLSNPHAHYEIGRASCRERV